MSTNVPKISVTTDSRHQEHQDSYEHHHSTTSSDSDENSDSNSNDMDYTQNYGTATDVEDFDSYGDGGRPCSRVPSRNSLVIPNDSLQGDVTDVEDYNDSDDDADNDVKSVAYSGLMLSLQEFLQHDVQEHVLTSNGLKEVVEHKTGDFLRSQNLNTLNDYLTDCEDYNTESEIENDFEKSVCVDLNDVFVEQGRVNIADATVPTKDYEDSDNDYDDISVVSDISDMASAVSDVKGKELTGMSEDEILEFSGSEIICQILCSDSESISNRENESEEDLLSSVSVAFVHTTKRSELDNDHLYVQEALAEGGCFQDLKQMKKEEVLTDIEGLDDSVAEGDNDVDDDSFDADDDNQHPIPQAVVVTTENDDNCVTDCEDLFCDDVSEGTDLCASIDPNVIPLPQREVVMLQENKYGDTITNVMPMDSEYQFGIYETLKEECVTDTEEYSCADDLDLQLSVNDIRSPSPSMNNLFVESDLTVTNEVLKTQPSKRLEIKSNTESVTDVEEIYMDGTNSRRKKLKTRGQSKSKLKYLDIPKTLSKEDVGGGGGCGAVTDIEDIDFSESGLPDALKCIKNSQSNHQSNQSHSDKATDLEDLTIDNVSENELPQIEANTSKLKGYEDGSNNIVLPAEISGHNRYKKTKNKEFQGERCCNQQQQFTNLEYIQFTSDAEDYIHNCEPAVDCVCQELNEMLNESCSTTVHEKCGNSFNVEAETLHIKGMIRESHTDIEYVESDESAARGSK